MSLLYVRYTMYYETLTETPGKGKSKNLFICTQSKLYEWIYVQICKEMWNNQYFLFDVHVMIDTINVISAYRYERYMRPEVLLETTTAHTTVYDHGRAVSSLQS